MKEKRNRCVIATVPRREETGRISCTVLRESYSQNTPKMFILLVADFTNAAPMPRRGHRCRHYSGPPR